jgi:hypothetical protein
MTGWSLLCPFLVRNVGYYIYYNELNLCLLRNAVEMHAFWKAAGDAELEQGGSWCQSSIDRADVSHDCGNVSVQKSPQLTLSFGTNTLLCLVGDYNSRRFASL